jgi:hypothetical protein
MVFRALLREALAEPERLLIGEEGTLQAPQLLLQRGDFQECVGELSPRLESARAPFASRFAVLPGDVSGDGVVSADDLILVRDQILAGTYLNWADVDGDGVVDLTDYTSIRKRIGSRLP